jgi:hypothetical protein
MTDKWRSDWVKKKGDVAAQLASRQCGGSYGDAAVILCSCLSALAAEVWPGTRIDQNRFVELLEKYTPPQLGSARVSIPLLVYDLRRHHMPEATQIESMFLQQFNAGQILTGDQVDKNETDIRAAGHNISLKFIRRSSYANLLYREVRCSYTHEGKIGQAAESSPQTESATHVSYFNWSIPPHRRIHFPVDWMWALTKGAADAVDRVSPIPPLQHPQKWWLEG